MLNIMLIPIKKDPKFKVSDHVTISKYKNIFARYVLTCKICSNLVRSFCCYQV